MRTGLRMLGWLAGLLLAVASCRTNSDLKPPKQPESYSLPPLSEDRFSKPPNYPKERNDEDPLKSKMDLDVPGMPGKPGGFGAGPGRM